MSQRTHLAILIGTALAMGASAQAIAQDTSQQEGTNPETNQTRPEWQQNRNTGNDQQRSNDSSAYGDRNTSAQGNRNSSAYSDRNSSSEHQYGQHEKFVTMQSSSQVLASKIIGMPVQDGASEDSEKLGEVKDLLLDKQHHVVGIVLDIGGVLGVGQKTVAISPDEVQSMGAKMDHLVVNLTEQQLKDAPAFTTKDDRRDRQGKPGQ